MSVPQKADRLVDERWSPEQPVGRPDQQRSETMRFMVIVKASKDSEAGVMPSTELLTAMGKFNEELVKAGMMEAGEGLHPSSKGARIKYQGGQGSATSGPFPLTNDLVAGFWLLKAKSLDEAIEWMKRAPFDGGAEIEIRQVFAAEDFGEALTPELREQEVRLRAQSAKK
jgi:hypothetical protein